MRDTRWAMVLSVALAVACNEEVGSRDAGGDGPRPPDGVTGQERTSRPTSSRTRR